MSNRQIERILLALAVAVLLGFTSASSLAQGRIPQVSVAATGQLPPTAIEAPHEEDNGRSPRGDCVADVDGDGDTDLSDLAILLADWGCGYEPQPDCPGDINGDGHTDAIDMSILLGDWACPDDDPGCDGEPSDALEFDVVTVDNSSVQPGDDSTQPEFNGGVTHFTFDLQVIVPGGDDWTASQAEAVLTEAGLTFFDHVLNDDTPPMVGFVNLFPAMEFDSFCASTSPDANNQPPWGDPSFADLTNQAQYKHATWFDTPPNGDAGVFTIARYTIVVPEGSGIVPGVVPAGEGARGPVIATIAGAATSKIGWGDCNTFAFEIVDLRACPGDVDGDYDVDQADLGMLLADWGCTSDCVGDVDGDDDVDQSDLGILLANWGSLCGGDCNENGVSDWQDIRAGTSDDCNENWIPDECEEGSELDCNENGAPDFCDLYNGTSQDFNNNGIPDECEENRTLYVDDDAPNDPGPGDPEISDPDEDGTAEHPYDAIQEAINATISRDVILVAEGVYTGPGNKEIDFGGRGVLLCSVNGPQTCTIDMEGDGRGFFFQSGETRAAQITGFTVTNGYANQGAGIRCENNSSPTVTGCIISGNSGGGVGCRFSGPAFIDCVIADNGGCGIGCRSGDSTFTNCIVAGNSRAGIDCDYSSSTIISCLIAGNQGGGIYCYTSEPTCINCLITGNSGGGGAVYCLYDSSPVLANCVLWGDTPREINVHSGHPQVSYSDIQGGWPGDGNIDADPLFVDPDGPDDDPDTWEDNDYRLGPGSPCIDAANNDAVPADEFDLDGDDDTDEPIPFDLDGNPRFVDDPDTDDTGHGTPPIVDMGAYEFQVPRAGDLDGDSDIDQADLGILLSDWGSQVNCVGDLDGDDDVDHADIGILLADWGCGR
jgi:hypothetical protein